MFCYFYYCSLYSAFFLFQLLLTPSVISHWHLTLPWVVPSWRELRAGFLLHYLVHFWIQLFYSDWGLHGAVCPWWGGCNSQKRLAASSLTQSDSQTGCKCSSAQWFWCTGCRTSRFTFHNWMRGCAIKIFKTGWYFWLTEFCFARW